MQEPADNILEITTAFTQIVVIEAIVCLEQIVTDLLNGPFRIDVIRFDLLDNPIDEQAILQHQKMRIDEE